MLRLAQQPHRQTVDYHRLPVYTVLWGGIVGPEMDALARQARLFGEERNASEMLIRLQRCV